MNNTVKNLKSLIKSTLKGDERLWFINQDNEQEFNQTLLLDLVEKVDNKIISLLLQEEVLREKFFVKIVPPRPAKLSTPSQTKVWEGRMPSRGEFSSINLHHLSTVGRKEDTYFVSLWRL